MSNINDFSVQIRRIRWMLCVVVLGLVFSGLTTFPLMWEVNILNNWLGDPSDLSTIPEVSGFISHIYEGVNLVHQQYPFFLYGLDWLGFAHIAIALAFLGPIRQPLEHYWVVEWAILVCLICVPAILFFGYIREMPLFWSLIDSVFPLIALVPLCIAFKDIRSLRNQLCQLSSGAKS